MSVKTHLRALKNASNYTEWKKAAKLIDVSTGADLWKHELADPLYNFQLIQDNKDLINRAIARKDIDTLIFHLKEGLHGNIGNIANRKLYQQSQFSTKHLIREYLNTVCHALDFLADAPHEIFSYQQKLDFFKLTSHIFGKTALMLSGGGSLGLFHIGVAKALWEEGLLPEIISGSSAGSIIAGSIGCYTDEELLVKLDAENMELQALKFVNWSNLFKGRPFLDGEHLEQNINKNIPEMTFLEAYKKTHRSINISVSPYNRHQSAKLLNWRTTPNVIIRKAILASCAIPGIFPPVTLTAKNMHGEIVPYYPDTKWIDGSIKSDLPIKRLSRMYGVNHTIVSQTNPHITPFLTRTVLKNPVLKTTVKLIRRNLQSNAELLLEAIQDIVPGQDNNLLLDKARSILVQHYHGDINIVPSRSPLNIFRALRNPNREQLRSMILDGERATWRNIEYIRNTTQISRTFSACIQRIKSEPTHAEPIYLKQS